MTDQEKLRQLHSELGKAEYILSLALDAENDAEDAFNTAVENSKIANDEVRRLEKEITKASKIKPIEEPKCDKCGQSI